MAVSKRLRFEILRRDNHKCRYCGAQPAESELQIDHVTPVSLGGSDDPSNLAAACKDCNAGKTSSNPDAPLVANVSDDALRWARAMEIVAQGRAVERMERRERYDLFESHWNRWTFRGKWQSSGEYEKRTIPLPGGWRGSIDQFLNAGLEMEDLTELIDVAMGSNSNDEWKYFCGCCWKQVRQSQEHAARIVAQEGSDPTRSRVETCWTSEELAEKQRVATEFASKYLSDQQMDAVFCRHQVPGHCGDPVCIVEHATTLEWLALDALSSQTDDESVVEAAEALLDG